MLSTDCPAHGSSPVFRPWTAGPGYSVRDGGPREECQAPGAGGKAHGHVLPILPPSADGVVSRHRELPEDARDRPQVPPSTGDDREPVLPVPRDQEPEIPRVRLGDFRGAGGAHQGQARLRRHFGRDEAACADGEQDGELLLGGDAQSGQITSASPSHCRIGGVKETMPAPTFLEQLPELEVTKADGEELLELEALMVAQDLEQYAQLLQHSKTKERAVAKVVPGSKWHEIRKVENLRIYEERAPSIPSIMMLGTVVGDLDDVMFGAVAATDADERIKGRVLQDGAEQSKVLRCLVQPSDRDPFRQVSVKWQLYSTRDYVCLDTTGFARASTGERVGYSLSHSIAFEEQLPQFDRHSIDRGNRSVCVLYRQRTPNTVECYARGFFDFETMSDPVANSVALQRKALKLKSLRRVAAALPAVRRDESTSVVERRRRVLSCIAACMAPTAGECK
ncbi:unnamed protein product [Phytophthora lilii]|uniref:Unnamed protein product n=1 Tax=Phytophthora lilii TaxID=2077276 RepID=A0A9W6U2S8_9STRA|nr:unnamed protein product [Phytophthora lilii]